MDSTGVNMQACIAACWQCRDACQSTLYQHCLNMGGAHLSPDHVRLMTDCIQICQTSADFMTRQSAMHHLICAACADICDACAQSCERIGDADMKKCADICHHCAQLCRAMSGDLATA